MQNKDVKKAKSVFSGVPHMIHGGDYNPDQWLDRPDILAEDSRLMKLAGLTVLRLGYLLGRHWSLLKAYIVLSGWMKRWTDSIKTEFL